MTATASRGRRARRTRVRLLIAAAALALAASAAVLLRARPAPYTPGSDADAGAAITHGLDRSLPEGFPKVSFVDAAAEAGLSFRHFDGARSSRLPEDMGSGLAWGDYDGDGDPDLFLVNEAGPLTLSAEEAARSPARSALYRNDGDGHFTEVTAAARLAIDGWGMGASWGDFDGDGDLDLVVTRFGTIVLERNDGDGGFTDVSGASGVDAFNGFWTGVSWADYDRDGDLDLYVAGYVRYRDDPAVTGRTTQQYQAVVPFTLNPSSYPPQPNLLLRNEGGRFRDVARAAGVDNPAGRSLSAAWADLDRDGWPDLYVANDISDNALFRNLGNGRFEDLSHSAWVADPRGAMGLGVGDWDNDGDPDLFIAHWIAQENALYDHQGTPLRFLDIADQVGLGQIALDFVGWGTGFLDYDNDGRLDLFVANGSTFEREDDPRRLVPMRNLVFWNAGPREGFFEAGSAAGAALGVENVGRGAAFADYDGDGDPDIAVSVNGGAARLLRNDGGERGGWLRVVLRGPAAPTRPGRLRTTTFANGAVVRLTAGGATQRREVDSEPSYLSQSPPGEVRFGVGAVATIERLEVDWPDGGRQAFTDLPANATVTLREGGTPDVRRAGSAPAAASADTPGEVTDRDAAGTDDAGGGDRDTVRRFWKTIAEATALRHSGDLAAAARSYQAALALRPDHEDALYYLGQCLQSTGRLDEARAAFARLVAVNPASARGHLALGGLALRGPGDPDLDTAAAHFARAHAINKEESGAMLHLGEIALARGDGAEAGRWLQSALRTNPKSAEALLLLGYLDWRSGDGVGATARCRAAFAAAAPPAPVQGVRSEGDRHASAPPITSPMGETLFSEFGAALRTAAARPGASAEAWCASVATYAGIRERIGRVKSAAP